MPQQPSNGWTPVDESAAPAGWTPVEEHAAQPPGFLDREIPLTSYPNAMLSGVQSVGRGFRDIGRGIASTLDPEERPGEEGLDTLSPRVPGVVARPIYRAAQGLAAIPGQAAQVPDAIGDINASVDPLGTYAKAAQETAGQGGAQAATAAATEGVARAIPKIVDALPTPIKSALGAPVRLATRVGEAAANQKLAPVRPILKLWTPADEAGAVHIKVPGRDLGLPKPPTPTYPGAPFPETPPVYPGGPLPEHPGTFPGAPLPETPVPELLKARSVGTGAQPYIDPAKGLGGIKVNPEAPPPPPEEPLVFPETKLGPPAPSRELMSSRSLGGYTKPEPQVAALGKIPVKTPPVEPAVNPEPPIQPHSEPNVQSLQQMLEDSLGASKYDPKAPIRQRPVTPQGGEVMEGHTPVKSSALQSYKYDPAAKEFHARTTSGDTTYIYGDVSPQDAQAFEKAESKGKAFQAIKGRPLVAKIKDGKRIAVTPAR